MSNARVSPRWEDERTVAGFVSSPPNEALLTIAREERQRGAATCLDIGCGAARNAMPLAELGFVVTGTDLSAPMLRGAARRISGSPNETSIRLVRAPMAPLPFRGQSFDFIVAHGIWNLARSGRQFRDAVAEAARVARPGAALFLFTFARQTIGPDAVPDPGETFVFSSWNGEPQCFLTEQEIQEALGEARFVQTAPLTLYNLPRPGEVRVGGPPVIYEGVFRSASARPSSSIRTR